jgi:hypothetical protein
VHMLITANTYVCLLVSPFVLCLKNVSEDDSRIALGGWIQVVVSFGIGYPQLVDLEGLYWASKLIGLMLGVELRVISF